MRAIGALATREDQAAWILGAVLGEDRQSPVERAPRSPEERYGAGLAALGRLALWELGCWRTAIADDDVWLTYFINSRGDEAMGTIWSYLDMTALGRQETWEASPEGYPQTPPYKWWNWHDSYVSGAAPDPKWVERSDAGEAAFRKRDA